MSDCCNYCTIALVGVHVSYWKKFTGTVNFCIMGIHVNIANLFTCCSYCSVNLKLWGWGSHSSLALSFVFLVFSSCDEFFFAKF